MYDDVVTYDDQPIDISDLLQQLLEQPTGPEGREPRGGPTWRLPRQHSREPGC